LLGDRNINIVVKNTVASAVIGKLVGKAQNLFLKKIIS